MMKRRCKKGGPALGTDKNFIRNRFLVCQFDYSRKKMGLKIYIFLKKPMEFLGLLFCPWKFWTKQSFIPGNPAKLYDTSWE